MKKENKNKNYGARESWMREKKKNRPKQVWVDYPTHSAAEVDAMSDEQVLSLPVRHWEKVQQ